MTEAIGAELENTGVAVEPAKVSQNWILACTALNVFTALQSGVSCNPVTLHLLPDAGAVMVAA